jgi:hypothetical protein
LGGLGAKDGLPVTHDWVRSGVVPFLLPWLAILGLLTLKPNRHAAAWLIWLPLALPVALTAFPLPMLPSNTTYLVDAIGALEVALSAVWLLSDYLARRYRIYTFLLIFLALAVFGVLTFGAQQGWNFGGIEIVQFGIVLALGVLVSALVIALAGLVCRGRHHPVGIYPWLLLWLAVVWTAVGVPIALYLSRRWGAHPTWIEFLTFILAVAIVHFVILLPLLILSSASSFYRHRLKALLHVKPESSPMISPLPADQFDDLNPTGKTSTVPL